MALGNKKDKSNASANTPEFEDEGTVAVAERPEAKEEQKAAAPTPAPEKEEKSSPSTAVSKPVATGVSFNDAAAKAKAFQKELEDMRGANDFAYGNYRVFKANQGEIQESSGDEESLGKWAKVRLLGWDNHFEVSPGEKGASTKDFVAYSKDGKIIDSVIGEEQKGWVGKSVQDYLDYLRDDVEGEGFEHAKVREFIDTAVALLGSESGDGPIGDVIQITLSESSMTAFSKYQQSLKDKARCVSMGIPGFTIPSDPFTYYYVREQASKGDNHWTKLKIVSELPAKI